MAEANVDAHGRYALTLFDDFMAQQGGGVL